MRFPFPSRCLMRKTTSKRTFLLGILLSLGGCGEPDTRSFSVENAIFESIYLDRAVPGSGRENPQGIAGGLAAICKGDPSGARRLIRESAAGEQIYRLVLVAAKARRDGGCDYSDWQEKQTLLGDRFKQLVNSGDPAAVLLASLLDRSLAAPDREKIVQALADRRYGHAQAIRAGMLIEGDAAGRDYGKALELLEDAAKQGATPASVLLARLHGEGLGTPKDSGKACKYLRDAANGGYEVAAGELRKYCPQT
jgi:TPR repeat protein